MISSCLNLRIASACSCSNSSCCLRSATSRMCCNHIYTKTQHKYSNRPHTESNVNMLRNRLNVIVLPLGPALGSPALHGVAGFPPVLNYAECSRHRAVPLAPHFQPETTETQFTLTFNTQMEHKYTSSPRDKTLLKMCSHSDCSICR